MNKITSRIKIIGFILSLLLVTLIAITVYLNEQSRHDAYVVNIVGKERMLTQKMAKELFLNLHTTQIRLDAFEQAKAEFEQNLETLRYGSHDGKIAPPPNEKIASKLEAIRSESTNFLSLAETFKHAIENGTMPGEEEMHRLYDLNNRLLDMIDQTVQDYSAASETKITRLQWIQYAGALMTLLAVGGSIVLSRRIDEEFNQFLINAQSVSQIRCDDITVEAEGEIKPQNELLRAESDMKTFLLHVEKVLGKAKSALMESKETLLQIEDAARMMETRLEDASVINNDREEIVDYIDVSENLTINSLEKIASTQQMLEKFQTMLDEIVNKLDKGTNR